MEGRSRRIPAPRFLAYLGEAASARAALPAPFSVNGRPTRLSDLGVPDRPHQVNSGRDAAFYQSKWVEVVGGLDDLKKLSHRRFDAENHARGKRSGALPPREGWVDQAADALPSRCF